MLASATAPSTLHVAAMSRRLLASIDAAGLAEVVGARIRHHSSGSGGASVSQVAVESLAVAMQVGASDEELAAIVDAVELVVRAIGRGESVGSEGDLACDELTALFDARSIDPVAGISVLYQVFDAIAALCKSVDEAEREGQERGSALAGTVRVAVADSEVAGLSVTEGDEFRLAFSEASQEFGAGPHQCPGRDIAWILAEALKR